MNTNEILNLIALIIIPIFAVAIGQFLQIRDSIRKEKVEVFKKLMTYRNIGYVDMTCVESLNQIPILFIRDKKVMENYKPFIELMNSKQKNEDSDNKTNNLKKKLLESLAKSLNYKKINWEIIETPYLPQEVLDNKIKTENILNNLNAFFSAQNVKNISEGLHIGLKKDKIELQNKIKDKNTNK